MIVPMESTVALQSGTELSENGPSAGTPKGGEANEFEEQE
jgi:hypothetical protein